jgi:hypothetical protein
MLRNIAVLFVALVALPWGGTVAGGQPVNLRATAAERQASDRARADLDTVQRNWLGRAWRQEKDGWVYLHVEGEPRERGFQHGYLLAEEIRTALESAKRSWTYESGMDWPWLVEKTKTMFVPRIDTENLAEIDGIVEGLASGGLVTSREEIVTFNAIIELAYYWWPKEKEKLGGEAKTVVPQSCSAFIATGSTTADGGIVLGHNTMCGYESAYCNVILDILPAKGHRILMQGCPGWIHSGSDFFITDAGLVGAETTLGGFKGFDETGIPEFVRMRRATQDASTIDQWCAIMEEGNNGGYANAWLLGDVNTGEIARLELGLKHVAFEKKKDGYFAGSNVAEDLKVLRFEAEIKETDVRLSSVARRVRWKQLLGEHKGEIDLERAKAMVADHYDSYFGEERPGGRTLCQHSELDAQAYGSDPPFAPSGTVDAKVVDANMARGMAFAARWGAACGTPFDAEKFLAVHPQFDWMQGILKSRPAQPWTDFRAE